MTDASTQLLELRGIAQRAATFRFDLLNQFSEPQGVLHPNVDSPPTIDNDTTRDVIRTMQNFILAPGDWEEIDFFSDRVQPVMVLPNQDPYPLGVFVFDDPSRARSTSPGSGITCSCSLQDLNAVLNQPLANPYSVAKGTTATDALKWLVASMPGIPAYDIVSSATIIGSPLSWSASSATYRNVVTDIATLCGYEPPWFDNFGTLHIRPRPSLVAFDTQIRYEDGLNIVADSIVESDNQLTTPNTYVVIDTSGAETPVQGVWQVPASAPWSVANRGYRMVVTKEVQGLSTVADANVAAMQWGESDSSGWTEVQWSSAPDPRHDTFDIISFRGTLYREVSWLMTCREGEPMTHTAQRSTLEGFV